jgi:hypothetical protein
MERRGWQRISKRFSIDFPDYRYNAQELRQLKAEIYKLLLSSVEGKKMVWLTEKLLDLVEI